jgi:hypothetical protein
LIRRWRASFEDDSGSATLSAEIIRLFGQEADSETELTIDLRTAVDVAIRDLREIQRHWGTDLGRDRLIECQEMLSSVFAAS